MEKESRGPKMALEIKNTVTKIKCSDIKVWWFSHMSTTSLLFLPRSRAYFPPLVCVLDLVTLF